MLFAVVVVAAHAMHVQYDENPDRHEKQRSQPAGLSKTRHVHQGPAPHSTGRSIMAAQGKKKEGWQWAEQTGCRCLPDFPSSPSIIPVLSGPDNSLLFAVAATEVVCVKDGEASPPASRACVYRPKLETTPPPAPNQDRRQELQDKKRDGDTKRGIARRQKSNMVYFGYPTSNMPAECRDLPSDALSKT